MAPNPALSSEPHIIPAPATVYQSRCAAYATQRDYYGRRSSQMANVNLALFIGALVALGIGVWQSGIWWYVLAGLLGLSFVISYTYHAAVDRHFRRFDELWGINNEGQLRLRRDWQHLPLRQASTPSNTDVAVDLDLLGHASLQHLLNTTYTPIGAQTLQQWLLQPATGAVIRQRQVAVQNLVSQRDFRDELAFRGRLMGRTQGDYEQFLTWAEDQPWLRARPALNWLVRALTLATWTAIIVQVIGLTDYPLWVPLVLINLGLVLTVGGHVDQQIDRVSARQSVFRAYAQLFQLINAQHFTVPELQRLQAELTADNHRADEQMRRLTWIVSLADFRLFMFYLPIQLVTLWNFHVLAMLEQWQQSAGDRVRNWLVALGEMEAVSALATLKHDHPDWCFPTLTDNTNPIIVADNLGHPLLRPDVRVDNSVAIGPPGTFLLVTGSNMSGKSTLLRSIGINVVLAQAGGPVCAAALALPPLTIATSMRVQDSLEQGVSYFMAEVQRLKAVVDLAERTRAEGERTLLFLLDEILHGTNTGERQIAARQIIRHLVSQGAIGAVSTHDLALADAPEIGEMAQLVHFTENFVRGPEGPSMSFDYTLRPGIATSTNALKLMELVGLPVDVDVPSVSH